MGGIGSGRHWQPGAHSPALLFDRGNLIKKCSQSRPIKLFARDNIFKNADGAGLFKTRGLS